MRGLVSTIDIRPHTAIVETQRGILLTAGRHGRPFILLGGGA